jgi:hypothetical protein
MITYSTAPQGSEAWLQIRKGRITGSKFKDARDFTKSGKPTAKRTLYARNVARERFGGNAEGMYQTFAMKQGQEQEPFARQAYETTTGSLVHEVGFAMTDCGMFGVSPDGEVRDDPEGLGGVEIKMMFGSDNLFDTVVDGDYSEYLDQCLGEILFLGWNWVDLCMWAPDLESKGLGLVVHRIRRSEHMEAIAKLKADLDAFAALVSEFESQLRSKAAANIKALNKVEPEPEILFLPDMARCCEKAAAEGVVVCAECAETGSDISGAFGESDAAIEPTEAQALPAVCEIVQTSTPSKSPPDLRLGQITERLGFALTADFLRTMGFEPAGRDRAAVLYHESDFPRICAALVKRINSACELLAA